MTFKTRVKELAIKQNPPLTPRDLKTLTGLSLNTIKSWMSNGDITRVDARVVASFMRVFELTDWRDLFESFLFDAWTDNMFDPTNEELIIE